MLKSKREFIHLNDSNQQRLSLLTFLLYLTIFQVCEL